MTLICISTLCVGVVSVLVNIVTVGVQIPVLQIIFILESSQLLLVLLLISVKQRYHYACLAVWIGAPKNRLRLLSRAVWGVAALVAVCFSLQYAAYAIRKSFQELFWKL